MISELCQNIFTEELKQALQVVSATFLLVCFVCLKKSTCETKKDVFYFTLKALFVLEISSFNFSGTQIS